MAILDCKAVKEHIIDEIKEELKQLNSRPTMAIVQVEGDDASSIYVRNKAKLADTLGIDCEVIEVASTATQQSLNQLIFNLSKDDAIGGIILQLPLPKHLNADEALEYLDVDKDLDGLTVGQQGYVAVADWKNALIPATPSGVIRLLDFNDIDLNGMDVVVVGRSRLFGIPMARLLMDKNATVTVCHSRTKDLKEKTKNADLVITAVGQPFMFDNSYFSDKTKYVIDVGISLVDGKMRGDVNVETLQEHISYTTTPGGTGQLTVPSLLLNLVKAYKKRWMMED